MVINVSTVLSRIRQDGTHVYCVQKGGMAGLSQAYDRLLEGQEYKVEVKSPRKSPLQVALNDPYATS